MSDHVKPLLEQVVSGRSLTEAQAYALLEALTDPSMPPALAGAFLAALRTKGETADEVRGFARAMRALSRRPLLPDVGPTIDIVGTGGDGSHTFNLSTGAALLAVSAGVRVVKHGNRSISSRSGSADVLEHLGLPIPLNEAAAADCLAKTGFTFLFAPHYHPAMKAVAPVRAALGMRTVFNLLGPLVNPAAPPFQLTGAYSAPAAALMAETLSGLPIQRAFVVHGEPGWDEPTPVGPFLLYDVTPGRVTVSTRSAADFGLPSCDAADLRGGDAAYNAAALRAVFEGRDRGAHRNALLMSAALAIELTGLAPDPLAAVAIAKDAIDHGAAAALLTNIARVAEHFT